MGWEGVGGVVRKGLSNNVVLQYKHQVKEIPIPRIIAQRKSHYIKVWNENVDIRSVVFPCGFSPFSHFLHTRMFYGWVVAVVVSEGIFWNLLLFVHKYIYIYIYRSDRRLQNRKNRAI